MHRVSELTGLTIQDVHLSAGAHMYCRGPRAARTAAPLTSQTVAVLARQDLVGLHQRRQLPGPTPRPAQPAPPRA